MKFTHLFGTFLGLCALQANAHYSIHESCGPIATLIESVMSGQQPRIQRARAELNSLQDSNVKELATYLFGSDTGLASKHYDSFEMLYMKLGHKNILTPEGRLPGSHVAFYCGTAAVKDYKEIAFEGGKAIHNTELNIAMTRSSQYKDCIEGSSSSTFAITYKNKSPSIGSGIYICEKEFQAMQKRQYKTLEDITDKIWEDIIKKPNPKFKLLQKTAMDMLGLFDHTIVHELMHTWPGGAADDIDSSGKVDSIDAYGWKNCVGNPNGHKNSDSLAFFVNGVYAIKDKGYKIRKDGWMEKISAPSRKMLRRWVA